MSKPKVLLWLVSLIAMVLFTSCGGEQGKVSGATLSDEVTLEEEIIDLNWNRAVKDLYYLNDGDGEMASN
jgi:hypothetical protein